jgi:hypothetical protein
LVFIIKEIIYVICGGLVVQFGVKLPSFTVHCLNSLSPFPIMDQWDVMLLGLDMVAMVTAR